MKIVALEELENRLSAYLNEVRNGEVVLVTDRGRVVAELRQPTQRAAPSLGDEALERLCAEGLLTPGLPQDARAYHPSPLPHAVASRDLLDTDRGDR